MLNILSNFAREKNILEMFSSFKVIKSLFFSSIYLYLMILPTSCISSLQLEPIPSTEAYGYQFTSTPILDTPKSNASQATLTPRPVNGTMTSDSDGAKELAGQLFIYSLEGIRRITLLDGVVENMLQIEKGYSEWGARFAQNQKYLAYWIKTENTTELWFTSLPTWEPERLLIIEDMDYDFATPLWGVNDRYLIFSLAESVEEISTGNIKTLRSYIIDIKTKELVNPPYWEGDCSKLAPSPQTGSLAIWCYKEDNDKEFLVLEQNINSWVSHQMPEFLSENCITYAKCAWSRDGQLVAYVGIGNYPQPFYYSTVNDPIPIRLDDTQTDIYSFPLWSPNSQYLYYSGACVEGGAQDPIILSVLNQNIIWCVWHSSSHGDYGYMAVSTVSWSPNSRFLAIPITPHIKEEILVLDIFTQSELTRISNLDGIILDMVWVND